MRHWIPPALSFERKIRILIEMFEPDNDSTAMNRGSCFIAPPTAQRTNFKKTLFTSTTSDDEVPKFHVRRITAQQVLPIGDSVKNVKDKTDEVQKKDSSVCGKPSRTFIIDKKNLKSGGHFGKLKKRNEVEYSLFLEQQTKHEKEQQVKREINRIQLQLEKLTKRPDFKEPPASPVHETVEIHEKIDENAEPNTVKKVERQKKFIQGFGFVCVIIGLLLAALYCIEGEKISGFVFSSGVVKMESKQPVT